tara:strand:- start:156 stop:518 length:363 start_codon:yes stop_codon:yes gene_type:complete
MSDVNGQVVIDWMVDELGFDDVVEGFEKRIDSDWITFKEDKENLARDWTIEIDDSDWGEVGCIFVEQRFKKGHPSQMVDEDDVFCGLPNHEVIEFQGEDNLFKKWLKKNWKEVYEGYHWE